MTTAHETLTEVARQGRTLREAIPEVYAANAALSKAVMETDGELSPKVRELIALAIGISKQCDGCVASHARGAAKQGATAQEVAETIGVAIMMNGGPATVWGPRAYSAFQEFSPESS
jgi:AhpD family alkylhydroperoxidase